MKQYTHAWLAFMAIKRIENYKLTSSKDSKMRDEFVAWLKNHNDGITQGAWYPDSLIHDNATGHILKFKPSSSASTRTFKKLPTNLLGYKNRKHYPLYEKPYVKDKKGILPDRCEAISQSVIDNFKVQQQAEKGEPIVPTSNQIALQLFMLSHYICDAHMPLHCDARSLSKLHSAMEKEWEKEVEKYFLGISGHSGFLFNKDSHPYLPSEKQEQYNSSTLGKVEQTLEKRKNYSSTLGQGNNKVYDYMLAICQYSYLISYHYWPKGTRWNSKLWQEKTNFSELSLIILVDAIESTAKIWFHTWKKYYGWRTG